MSVTTPFWISAFLDFAADDFERGVTFWAQVTGCRVSPRRGDDGEFATLVPPDGDDFLRVQELREGPGGLHLDLHVPGPDEAARAAVRRGATIVTRHRHGYVVLSSPGGLTFCFVRHRSAQRPSARAWPGGPRSLVDQVCLDIPVDLHEAEVAFWQGLTGWELRGSPVADEFHSLVRPPGMPLRLLLQRLGETGGPVRAHLDLAATDRRAETTRHLALGAQVQREHALWTVLTDPTGSAYCVTDRDPGSGMLPREPER